MYGPSALKSTIKASSMKQEVHAMNNTLYYTVGLPCFVLCGYPIIQVPKFFNFAEFNITQCLHLGLQVYDFYGSHENYSQSWIILDRVSLLAVACFDPVSSTMSNLWIGISRGCAFPWFSVGFHGCVHCRPSTRSMLTPQRRHSSIRLSRPSRFIC